MAVNQAAVPSSLLRPAVGIALVLHGAVHLMGFLDAFDLAEFQGLSGTPALFDAAPDSPTVLAFGLLWLVAAVAVVVSGIAVLRSHRRATQLVAVGAGISLVPAVAFWSDAWVGVALSGIALVIATVSRVRQAGESR